MAPKAKRGQYKQWKTNFCVPIPKRTLARLKKADVEKKHLNLCSTKLTTPVDLHPFLSDVTDQTGTDIIDTLDDRMSVSVLQQPITHGEAATESPECPSQEELTQVEDTSVNVNESDTEFLCESDSDGDYSDENSDQSSSEEMDLDRDVHHDMSSLIYPGASITTEESILSIMKFSIRHKCTYAATTDLLALVSLHLPPNSKKDHLKSLYFLKKAFSAKEQSDETVSVKEYCPNCCALLENESSSCEFCGKARGSRDKNYFLSLDIREQIKEMFKGVYFKN